jgi:hypothetical protein
MINEELKRTQEKLKFSEIKNKVLAEFILNKLDLIDLESFLYEFHEEIKKQNND